MLEKLGLGIVLDANDKMSGKADRAARSMDKLGRSAGRAGDKVVGQTDRMTAALSRYARGFTVGLKMVGLGMAIEAPLLLMGKGAAETEHAFSEIRSLMVDTGLSVGEVNQKLEELQSQVYEVAVNSILPFRELLQGLYPLASKFGVDVAAALFEPVSTLAVAGKGTMLDAVRVMNQMFDTFGAQMPGMLTDMEKAKRIVNILAGTIKLYDTDLMRLSESMKYATPLAMVLGLSMEETASMVGALTGVMVTGSKAGTAYEALLRGLVNFTRRLQDQTGEATMSMANFIKISEGGTIGSTGARLAKNPLAKIQYADPVTGKLRPMTAIIREIADLFGIRTAEDIAKLEENQYILEAFQAEGARGLGILMKMIDVVEGKTKVIGEMNSADAMANAIMDDTWSRVQKLKSAFRVLSDKIGTTILESVTSLTGSLDTLRISMTEFVKVHPDVVKWVLFGVAASGALLMLAGFITLATFTIKTAIESIAIILSQIGWLTSVLARLGNTVFGVWIQLKLMALWTSIVTAATWLWNVALAANPIVWIILAVLALGAAIYLLIKHWDKVSDAASGFFENLKKKLDEAPTWLVALSGPIPLLIKHWDEVTDAIVRASGAVKKFADDIPTWYLLMSAPSLLIIKHLDEIGGAIKQAWDLIIEHVKAFVTKVSKVLIGAFSAVGDSMVNAAELTWKAIREIAIMELGLITESYPFKALMELFKFFEGGGAALALHRLGFGKTFTGISDPKSYGPFPPVYGPLLPAPAYIDTTGEFIGPPLPSPGETNTDYSIHRNQINIYPKPQQSPSDIAKEIDSVLQPAGEF